MEDAKTTHEGIQEYEIIDMPLTADILVSGHI
jgi:hypothetical protein